MNSSTYVIRLCIYFKADLAFKQEEKAKSEATAKTLEFGKFTVV